MFRAASTVSQAPTVPVVPSPFTSPRKRGLGDVDATPDGPSKRQAVADPPQDHIARLHDLPAEVHGAIAAYLPPSDIVQYVGALPLPKSGLPEGAASALCLDIRGAQSFAELHAMAARLTDIHPAFRHRPIQHLQVVLGNLALWQPVQRTSPILDLLQTCRDASVGLADRRTVRLQHACDEISVLLRMRRACTADQLLVLARQIPSLRVAARANAVASGMQATYRMLRAESFPGIKAGDLEAVALAHLDVARDLPVPDRVELVRRGYLLLAEADRQLQQLPWAAASLRLYELALALPPTVLHRAVPADENQFVDVVSDMLAEMPDDTAVAFFDTLAASVPAEGPPRLAALSSMTLLLLELPDNAIAPRMQRIGREVALLARGLANREAVMQDLVSDLLLSAVAPADRPALLVYLLDAVEGAGFEPAVRDRLLRELDERVELSPPAAQDAMRALLQRARAFNAEQTAQTAT